MKVFAFDTETTGLIENMTIKEDKLPEIIEFFGCYVDLSSGQVEDEIEFLIKPKGSLNLQETKLVITEEMLADKAPFAAHAEMIKGFIEAAPIVIGHNVSFDKEMVDVEMKRIGMSVKWPRSLCTVEQTAYMKGFRLSLTNLHQLLFETTFVDAHRAKADTMATVRCACELYKRGLL